jgi:hypothetical protein
MDMNWSSSYPILFAHDKHGVEGVDGMDSNISDSTEFGEVKKNLFH